MLLLEPRLDVQQGPAHVDVVEGPVADGGDHGAGLFVSVVGDKPARGLRESDDLEDEEHGEHGLESEGEAILERRLVERGSVVRPVCYDHAQDRHGSLQREQSSSDIGRRAFALVHRRRRRVHSIADASHDATHEQLSDRMGRAEDGGADDHDEAACHQHRPSTKPLSNKVAEDRSKNTPDVIQASDVALHGGTWVVKIAGEGIVGANDAGHDTFAGTSVMAVAKGVHGKDSP